MLTFQVKDMTCGHCVATITKAVTDLDTAARVNIDLAVHRVQVESVRSAEQVAAAISDAGFTPIAVGM